MIETDFLKSYPNHVAQLQRAMPRRAALEAAVGGEFETVGKLERALLISLGLDPGHLVVDVGCGSGRLSCQLAPIPDLRYIGTDVVPDLLGHARQLSARPDWQFLLTDGSKIPCPSEAADFVCFFSVFTHLTHEDSFRYLIEAKRALKPGGLIVLSFLEFLMPNHWLVFERSCLDSRAGSHLNQFIERNVIETWSRHLGLELLSIADGDKPHIPLEEELCWSNGVRMVEKGYLGQSVAVLQKRACL